MLDLVLHPSELRRPRHRVRGSVRKAGGSDLLTIRFEVEGAQALEWPVPAVAPARKDDLWKHTCFECFFAGASPNLSAYREWNFSPSGDWAAYAFDSYREGMRKPNLMAPSIVRSTKGEQTRIEIEFADEWLYKPSALSLTAVMIEAGDRKPFYWALAHCGAQPDFHLRESFTLELEA